MIGAVVPKVESRADVNPNAPFSEAQTPAVSMAVNEGVTAVGAVVAVCSAISAHAGSFG